MEEAPENGKEPSHFAHANGMNVYEKINSIRVARNCWHLWHRNVMCDFLAENT